MVYQHKWFQETLYTLTFGGVDCYATALWIGRRITFGMKRTVRRVEFGPKHAPRPAEINQDATKNEIRKEWLIIDNWYYCLSAMELRIKKNSIRVACVPNGLVIIHRYFHSCSPFNNCKVLRAQQCQHRKGMRTAVCRTSTWEQKRIQRTSLQRIFNHIRNEL